MSYTFDDILILVVANIKEDRTSIMNILSKYFKNIIEAENGKIAYEIFRENKNIDIIISDIEIPEIDGINLLKLVRMSDLRIPFILTTEQIDSEVLLKAIEFNVSSFLLKPINLSKLLEKVDLFCEQRIIEKKLALKQEEIGNYLKAVDKVSLIYKMHEDGKITYMNESMKEVSKYTDEELLELNFGDIIHPDIPKNYLDETWTQIKDNKLWKGNTKFISKDNEVFYLNNTIFKINNVLKDEYITISFLNTKENLEKRDFHKKVILNIKEANKKENELKIIINNLNNEMEGYKTLISNYDEDNLSKLEHRITTKEKQIKLLESEKMQFQDKYDKMLKNKKDEIEHHINNAQKLKMNTDKLKLEVKTQNEELDSTHTKIKLLIAEVTKKDKIIKDLRFIIEDMESKEIIK